MAEYTCELGGTIVIINTPAPMAHDQLMQTRIDLLQLAEAADDDVYTESGSVVLVKAGDFGMKKVARWARHDITSKLDAVTAARIARANRNSGGGAVVAVGLTILAIAAAAAAAADAAEDQSPRRTR